MAVLAAPGKLLAEGSPVSLKSSVGEGYNIVIHSDRDQPEGEKGTNPATNEELLATIQHHAQETTITSVSLSSVTFSLKTKDPITVKQILAVLEHEERKGRIGSYEVNGTSLEDIFLDLMGKDRELHENDDQDSSLDEEPDGEVSPPTHGQIVSVDPSNPHPTPLNLSHARPTSLLYQSLTIFYKRLLVLRRSWLSPLLAVGIACCGACIPLFYMNDREITCAITFIAYEELPLWLPISHVGRQAKIASGITPFIPDYDLIFPTEGAIPRIAPPDLLDIFGLYMRAEVAQVPTVKVADKYLFMQDIEQNVRNLTAGGVWVDTSSRESVLAYEAVNGLSGPIMLNLVSNVLFSAVGGADDRIIDANYRPFPFRAVQGIPALKWVRPVFGVYR